MAHVGIIGAGITGVTAAYALLDRGHNVTVFERHHYPAMETSFANGGQLSASNAEVWNNIPTLLKGMRWMFQRDAPLLLNPAPSWHKYSWMAEFIGHVRNHRENTVRTTRLAIEARKRLLEIAEREGISFDLERRGILHIYHDKNGFEAALQGNRLLQEGGLERWPVTLSEIKAIEPTLQGDFYGGLFTPSDATGDIHKFSRGLAAVCMQRGAAFVLGANVDSIDCAGRSFQVGWHCVANTKSDQRLIQSVTCVDKIVICAGVESRRMAAMLGDRINIYPVKGYSITVHLDSPESRQAAPSVSLLDENAKIVTSRLGTDRFRVAGTAELNGFNYDIRADRIDPLTSWVRTYFPGIETSKVVPWAGLRPMMPNMMPVVQRGLMSGVYYNTGHGHLGWTLSMATAEAVAQILSDGATSSDCRHS